MTKVDGEDEPSGIEASPEGKPVSTVNKAPIIASDQPQTDAARGVMTSYEPRHVRKVNSASNVSWFGSDEEESDMNSLPPASPVSSVKHVSKSALDKRGGKGGPTAVDSEGDIFTEEEAVRLDYLNEQRLNKLHKDFESKHGGHSRFTFRERLAYSMRNTTAGKFIGAAIGVTAFVSVILYVYQTYQSKGDDSLKWFDFTLDCIFICDYSFFLYIADQRLEYMMRPQSIADFMSCLPALEVPTLYYCVWSTPHRIMWCFK